MVDPKTVKFPLNSSHFHVGPGEDLMVLKKIKDYCCTRNTPITEEVGMTSYHPEKLAV